jgi:DNA primase
MTIATQKTRGKLVRSLLPSPIKYYKTQNIDLKSRGEWCDAICPFHPDKKPSLRIKLENGAYRCMVCGAHGGDVLAFHRHKHGLNFVEACKQLGAWVEGSQ